MLLDSHGGLDLIDDQAFRCGGDVHHPQAPHRIPPVPGAREHHRCPSGLTVNWTGPAERESLCLSQINGLGHRLFLASSRFGKRAGSTSHHAHAGPHGDVGVAFPAWDRLTGRGTGRGRWGTRYDDCRGCCARRWTCTSPILAPSR
jgi:hypothetical protein